MVDEKDATAVALGYVADASQVDKAKYANFTAGQNCAGCALYQGGAAPAGGSGSSLTVVAPICRQRISAAGPGRLSARLRIRVPRRGLSVRARDVGAGALEHVVMPASLSARQLPTALQIAV